MTQLLEIEDLSVDFAGVDGPVHAVGGISYTVDQGETVAVVGESGCGKSVSALAVLGLVPSPPGRVAGRIRFAGRDLLTLDEDAIRTVRGRQIAMVFQEPMTSLNPVLTIGTQVTEGMRRHLGIGRQEAAGRAVDLLRMVGIAEPRAAAHAVPPPLQRRHAPAGDDRGRAQLRAPADHRR